MKVLPNEPLYARNISLEMAVKLPQGACDIQAFISTLIFDPSMSTLPIIVNHNQPRFELLAHKWGT